MGQYDKVASPYEGGRYTNPGMISMMKTYCAIAGHPLNDLSVMQGSFNTGVAASAGTHDKADCLDLSDYNFAAKCKTLKLIGAAAWHRTSAQGFTPHVHLVRMYSTAMAWLATAQDEAYRSHKSDGLGNLSHTDSSFCPRYRSIKHLGGPTTNKYYAVRSTPGYSQPGCTPTGDKDLIVVTRPKKFLLSNVAGTVRAKSKDYFVTNGRGFYLKDDFIRAYSGMIWLNQNYVVEDSPAYGRWAPGLTAAKRAGAVRDKGFLVGSIGYADRDGKRFVVTARGTWYVESSLKKI